MSELKIRQYKHSDFDQVWDLHIAALKQAGAYISSGAWDEDLKDIATNYLKEGEFLVGLVDNKIIAMGAIRKISEKVAELKRMRVDPKFQGQGFGQDILEALEQRAKQLNYKEIILDTTEKQVAAQKMYLKNGYKETNRGFVNPPGLEFIYYQKVLI